MPKKSKKEDFQSLSLKIGKWWTTADEEILLPGPVRVCKLYVSNAMFQTLLSHGVLIFQGIFRNCLKTAISIVFRLALSENVTSKANSYLTTKLKMRMCQKG